jgi:hypothetical protein
MATWRGSKKEQQADAAESAKANPLDEDFDPNIPFAD